MYKLTEKEYNEKNKKFKETFIYSRNRKKRITLIIILAIFAYFLFNGVMTFTYLIFYANNNSELYKNEEMLNFVVTINSLFLTIGLIGSFISSIKLINLNKEDNKLFII